MQDYVHWFNKLRIHGTLGYLSLIEYKLEHLKKMSSLVLTIQSPQIQGLERRLNQLERQSQQQTRKINRLTRELQQQEQSIERINRRLNRVTQRLRAVEQRFNFPFTPFEGGF